MSDNQQRIDQIVCDYLQGRHEGAADSVDQIISRYPDLRPELAEAFRRITQIDAARTIATAPDAALNETISYDGGNIPAGPSRLRVRCPHCLHQMAIPPRQQLLRLKCEACDADFGLADPNDHALPEPIGNFHFVERLGVGGFGAVWKAHDTELNRFVAIKLPRHGKLAQADVERFIDEARVVAQLNHPGVVRVLEVGRDGDRVYIVSDLIEGEPLTEKVAVGGMPWREAAELCVLTADALAHAHASGIIHRDLKPANILLDEEGRPHITDFGLAKHTGVDVTVTADGHILGTPAYMSPEQAEGRARDTDARSDVYSLGVVLYELLTGERPFRGDLVMLMRSVARDPPPRPRSLRVSIPRDLEVICLKCLEKRRDGRYSSAEALANDLRRFLAGEPIQARPIGWPEQLRRSCWRHPFPAGLMLTTLVMSMLTVAGAISIARVRQSDLSNAIRELSAYRHERAPEIKEIELIVARAADEAAEEKLHEQSPGVIQDFVRTQYDRNRRMTDLPAHRVLSWYWQDATGKMVAIYPTDRSLVGRDFSQRDYFRGAVHVESRAVYVSEPYLSQNDGLFKFAVSTAIRDADLVPVAVLSASVATETSHAIQREERLIRLLRLWAIVTLFPLLFFSSFAIVIGLVQRRRTIGTSPNAVTDGTNGSRPS